MMDDIAEQQDVAKEISEAISNPVAFGHDIDEVGLNYCIYICFIPETVSFFLLFCVDYFLQHNTEITSSNELCHHWHLRICVNLLGSIIDLS